MKMTDCMDRSFSFYTICAICIYVADHCTILSPASNFLNIKDLDHPCQYELKDFDLTCILRPLRIVQYP